MNEDERTDGLVGAGDVRAQARQCLENLARVLAVQGFELTDVHPLTVYVVGPQEHLSAAWEKVAAWFGGEVPPATLLGVHLLGYRDQMVEIDAQVQRAADGGRSARAGDAAGGRGQRHQPLDTDEPAAVLAHAVAGLLHPVECHPHRLTVRLRLAQQGGHLLALERDRGALGVVLVVDVRLLGRGHDVVEAGGERVDLRVEREQLLEHVAAQRSAVAAGEHGIGGHVQIMLLAPLAPPAGAVSANDCPAAYQRRSMRPK